MNEEVKDRVIKLCAGNPGALRVLIDLVSTQKPDRMLEPLEAQGVQGPGIWILYKDICNQQLDALVDLLLSSKKLRELSEGR